MSGSSEKSVKLLEEIGRGAMGTVRMGLDPGLNRHVAVKLIAPELAEHAHLVARFVFEAQITAQLDHPSVVPVYALETREGDTPAYTMKLIKGKTFGDLVWETQKCVDQDKPIPETHTLSTLLEHFLKVCDAMAYAHSRGFIHRDLKPENVMVGSYNEVYVMDWGIARAIDKHDPRMDDAPESSGVNDRAPELRTRLGDAIGTPAYMSPEQALGQNDKLDARSDQFLLGLILFELVTLKRAMKGRNPDDVFRNAAIGATHPIEHRSKHRIPTELKAIIAKAIQPDPNRRYASVDDLAEDIRRYQRGNAIKAQPDTGLQALLRWISKNRGITLILLLGALLFGITTSAGALIYQQYYEAQQRYRQFALATALTDVADRSHRIDQELMGYTARLEGLAGAAEEALSRSPESTTTWYLSEDYVDPKTAPPDLAHSDVYRGNVSFDWPVFKLAPGVSEETVSDELSQLIGLRSALKKLSKSEHIRWAYVASKEGIHTSYPGHGPYPESYDPRVRAWYTSTAHTEGAQWSPPYLDVNGLGVMFPCNKAIYDRAGTFRGVVGVELTLDDVVAELLAIKLIPGVEEAFLLNHEGGVLVSSSAAGTTFSPGLHGNKALTLDIFDVPEAVAAAGARQSGYVEDQGQLVMYYPLSAIQWSYVVRGSTAAILDAPGR